MNPTGRGQRLGRFGSLWWWLVGAYNLRMRALPQTAAYGNVGVLYDWLLVTYWLSASDVSSIASRNARLYRRLSLATSILPIRTFFKPCMLSSAVVLYLSRCPHVLPVVQRQMIRPALIKSLSIPHLNRRKTDNYFLTKIVCGRPSSCYGLRDASKFHATPTVGAGAAGARSALPTISINMTPDCSGSGCFWRPVTLTFDLFILTGALWNVYANRVFFYVFLFSS